MNLITRKLVFILSVFLILIVISYFWSNNVIPYSFHLNKTDTFENSDAFPAYKTEDEGFNVVEASQTQDSTVLMTKGYYIYINLDELQMYVYKDGDLLKTYYVSGGSTHTPSPLGTWKIISKDTWGEGFGGAWLGFNVPWGKYGIHGTVEPWFIGRSNSSKGCIRMKNKDVSELFKMVPYGTKVTIAQNNRPFRILRDGDVGSDVAEVQMALKNLEYYKGSIDGTYGQGLKSAVKLFQKQNKLYSTGIINISTYNLIMEKYYTSDEDEDSD